MKKRKTCTFTQSGEEEIRNNAYVVLEMFAQRKVWYKQWTDSRISPIIPLSIFIVAHLWGFIKAALEGPHIYPYMIISLSQGGRKCSLISKIIDKNDLNVKMGKKGGKKKGSKKKEAKVELPPKKLYDIPNAHELALLSAVATKTDWYPNSVQQHMFMLHHVMILLFT